MNYFDAIILGVVEGLTEFLPISSTGHLTIAEKMLGLEVDDPAVTGFTAVIQMGAIAAVILYFAREGCRWCALQEEELRGIPVVRVPAGSPLWAEHGVTVTPTLVVDGKVLRGFTRRDALLQEFRHD